MFSLNLNTVLFIKNQVVNYSGDSTDRKILFSILITIIMGWKEINIEIKTEKRLKIEKFIQYLLNICFIKKRLKQNIEVENESNIETS